MATAGARFTECRAGGATGYRSVTMNLPATPYRLA